MTNGFFPLEKWRRSERSYFRFVSEDLEESAIFEDEKHYESASDSEYDSDLEEENVFSKLLSEEMRNC